MGCASSKQKVCRKCKTPYFPVRRSLSTRHRRKKPAEENSDHLVSLTASTLGSLNLPQIRVSGQKLDTCQNQNQNQNQNCVQNRGIAEGNRTVIGNRESEEFSMTMIEAKTWSEMIEKKIPKIVPKTPVRTPPGEPETINVWELMEGLDDNFSPLRQVHHHFRSFSFNVSSTPPDLASIDDASPPPAPEKPSVDHSSDSDSNSNLNSDTSIISEFDPDVIASFRKALEDLPPANPFHLNPIDNKDNKSTDKSRGDKVTVYFTSLRGVRKTYEDCCHVRVILKGLGVKIDERDVSMHAGFKEELKELLGQGFGGLPRVFVGKKYIGGADEIRRQNDEGTLHKTLESCELLELGNNRNRNVCESCGDIRFVPCCTCSGSCKIYYDGDYNNDDYEEEEDVDEIDEEEHEYGFQRCPDCNENGLIRCPICCDDY
ncbi:uncharacterized protein At3g28850-like [Andrographis paniculata]|uniref:uncharacterized protein At3g28850-like n=1 Tax=Andrographis paniculata TaxID=175694 RepID=UPI0021E7436B|nr:uncharacterized protein At3g28850-like [Andrographis paniculata]